MSDTTHKAPRPKGTGGIFKPKGSSFYWIAYTSGGKRRYEGTKSSRKKVAEDLLRDRLGDVSKGIVVTPRMGKITLREAMKAVVDDLKLNGRQSATETERRIENHIVLTYGTPDSETRGYFNGDRRLNSITTSELTAFASDLLSKGSAPA
jgi:hypothetical protein